MQTINPQIISGKKVLLRYDIDVALGKVTGNSLPAGKAGLQVTEDFKLRAGLKTLNLCMQNAGQVIMMGHVGRPDGKIVEELRVAPIVEWFRQNGLSSRLESGKLKLLENLRFDPREEACDPEFAKELASMGDFYVNEAFSSYRPAVSTTVLPTLLPHAAGLRFAREVRVLTGIRENPKKPFIAIMGGAKLKNKLPVINVLAQRADAVLVGGKLIAEIREEKLDLPANVLVGKLNEDGFDIASETVEAWKGLINKAEMIVWNGPLGKFEDPKYDATKRVGEIVVASKAEIIVGGGDIIAALSQAGVLDKISFVSVGGGAMLKLLTDGILPTIEALK